MRIAIIGAGFMGLSAAWEALQHEGVEVVLYERDSQPGGLGRSFEIAGQKWECYHHFVSADDEHLLDMARSLGVHDDISWSDTRLAYFIDGKLAPFVSPVDLLKFPGLTLWDKFRFGRSMISLTGRKYWKPLEKIPARQWLIENQGERTYERLWAHLMEMKFGDEVGRVPLSWLWSRGRRRVSNRKLSGSTERFGVFNNSADSVALALVDKIKDSGGELRMSTEVNRLERGGGGKIIVHTEEDREKFDRVIVTVPLPAFIDMTSDMGLPKVYVTALKSIKYAAIINMVVALSRPLSEYFWLNVSDRDMPFPGVIEMTHLRPGPEGLSLIYIPNYMDSDHPDFELTDDEWFGRYFPALKRINPLLTEKDVKIYRVFRDRYADPYYTLNYSKAAPAIETPIGGVFLANTAQVYPITRSLNNSIGWGKKAARISMGKGRKA